MKREELRSCLLNNTRISFSLSGGPGGQNVNKVNTRVTFHLPVDSLSCLTEEEKAILTGKLKNRINSEGCIVVESSATRSQGRNRKEGMIILEALIVAALIKPPRRKNTKPSRASVKRRLESKKKRSTLKRTRNSVDSNE